MPRRSNGCEECRRRKVRCDGNKPDCTRCVRYGVKCPGYRQQSAIGDRFVIHTANTGEWHNANPRPTAIGKDEFHAPGQGMIVLRSREEGNIRPWHARLENVSEDFDAQELEFVQPSPRRINLQQLYRLQMLAAFLDVRFPSLSDKAVAKSSYVAALPGMDLSMPLIQAAIDSLCFAGLGSAYKDHYSLQEAQRRYGRALGLLADEVSRPPSRIERRRPVVASMMLLCLCEQFDAMTVGEDTAAGWVAHLNGAQQYLKACGTSVISTPFDWLLFHNLRLSALFLGVVQRKAVVFAEPEWLDLTNGRKPDGTIALNDLSNLAMSVPSILERTDTLLDTPLQDTFWKLSLMRLGKDIVSLRSKFDDWLLLVHASEVGYTVVPIGSMRDFPCSNPTFPTVFNWHSTRCVRQYTMYWIFGLILNCTALRLMHFLPHAPIEWPWDTIALDEDAYRQASSLCRTVPYCANHALTDIRELSSWYLDFAQNYFIEAGVYRDELAWCREARTILEVYAPNAAHSTRKLWNLGRIAPYASVPARYKTPDLRVSRDKLPRPYPIPVGDQKLLTVDWALNAHNSATFVEELKPSSCDGQAHHCPIGGTNKPRRNGS